MDKFMTVADFIKYLQTQPQDLWVGHKCCSEYVLLDSDDISIVECCLSRPDGWLQRERPDMPKQRYLMLPGN